MRNSMRAITEIDAQDIFIHNFLVFKFEAALICYTRSYLYYLIKRVNG